MRRGSVVSCEKRIIDKKSVAKRRGTARRALTMVYLEIDDIKSIKGHQEALTECQI